MLLFAFSEVRGVGLGIGWNIALNSHLDFLGRNAKNREKHTVKNLSKQNVNYYIAASKSASF